MKKECRDYREWFAEALYGELAEGRAQKFQAHLDECGECRDEFARMRGTLQVMDRRETADPGAAYWDSFWERLEEKLPPAAQAGTANIVKLAPASRSSWLYRSVAAAAILLLGIFIGKTFFSPAIDPDKIATANDPLLQAAAVNARTQNYLEKSKVLLVGLVNFEPSENDPPSIDLTHFRRASRDLIAEAGYLKPALQQTRQQRLGKLVNDLELLLIQIANLEAENDISAIEVIKSGVDERGILLKINLEEMRQAAPRKTDEDVERGA